MYSETALMKTIYILTLCVFRQWSFIGTVSKLETPSVVPFELLVLIMTKEGNLESAENIYQS
jgi:hypothetical protein